VPAGTSTEVVPAESCTATCAFGSAEHGIDIVSTKPRDIAEIIFKNDSP
jgi:hypothetical protein